MPVGQPKAAVADALSNSRSRSNGVLYGAPDIIASIGRVAKSLVPIKVDADPKIRVEHSRLEIKSDIQILP